MEPSQWITEWKYKKKDRKERQVFGSFQWTKKLRMTVVWTEISALETVSKNLIRGLEKLEVGGRAETVQITYC